MLGLEFRETLGAGAIGHGAPVADLACESVGGETFLVAATQAGGGMTGFALRAGTAPDPGEPRDYGPAVGGLSGVDLVRVEQGGHAYLLPAGPAFPAWSGRELAPGFGLRGRTALDAGPGAPGPGRQAEAVTLDGATYLFSTAPGGVDITAGRITADLGLADAGLWRGPDRGPGGQLTALAATATGYLLAAGTGGDALTSLRIGADGRLDMAGRAAGAGGPGLGVPAALATFETAEGSHAVLAAAGSGSLTVFRVGADGALDATDHMLDTRDTRFGGAALLAPVSHGDWHLLLAAGADDGISLLALLPGGRLLHLDSIADSAAAALDNVAALAAVVLGDELQVFAASQREPGISRFTADLSGLGAVLRGGGALAGGPGADLLVATGAGAALLGGGGEDVFVFAPAAADAGGYLGRVLDYVPGEDRIDLSALPFLHDPTLVAIEPVPTGAILRFGDYRLEVGSGSGRPLGAGDFAPGAILAGRHAPLGNVDVPDPPPEPEPEPGPAPGGGGGGSGPPEPEPPEPEPPRPKPPRPEPGRDLAGGPGADRLAGGAGADRLAGMEGDDRLSGLGGDDTLLGSDGADTLNGGDGDDLIAGGETGADRRDVIYGGAGNDSIDAGHGNDLVYGMDGDDIIAGGFGADEILGQNGNDVITGSAFSDLIFAGAGNDFVNGGFGHDRISGGAGADRFFHAAADAAQIEGHGADWVQDFNAMEGDVLLFGGAGTRADFQVNFAHTATPEGDRSGRNDVAEAFVIHRPTGQILWALVDGAGQPGIGLTIAGSDTVFDLLG
ncbi:MAG: calcium-binding protein [Jhaorihella sp.]